MEEYATSDFLRIVLDTYAALYPVAGYDPPWIGYLALYENLAVGVGGYKGKPVNNIVEIAYGTVPEFEGKGIAGCTCRYLTQKALFENPSLQVTARTLMEEGASTRVLRKNGFILAGNVMDPEDGEVWEWKYVNTGADPETNV